MSAILLRFIGLGTFIGGGVFLAVSSSFTGTTELSLWNLIQLFFSVLAMSGLAWFMSLPFGAIPASAAGICYWYILSRHTKSNPRLLIRGVIGGGAGLLVSLIFGLLFAFGGSGPGAPSVIASLFSWACAGVAGGALSAMVVGNAAYNSVFENREVIGEA
ncbi:MAG: hypothetical protein KDG52_01875 [Rhodocyclaceae bacterium]|nr:hypothetical protein [Rhodocyclaceae bacterium]